MTTLICDYDYIKYSIGSIAETRSIVVTHKQSGNQKEFTTRTKFYGHHSKKEGGWLGEQNKGKLSPWTVGDFIIEDKQEAEPVGHALRAVRSHIESVINKLGAKSYYGYIGKGDSWRVEASTIIKVEEAKEAVMNARPEKPAKAAKRVVEEDESENSHFCCTRSPASLRVFVGILLMMRQRKYDRSL